MDTVLRAERFLRESLEAVAACHGVGVDARYPTPTRHPMADGRLLSAAAAMRRAGLLDGAGFGEVCDAAAGRLERTARPLGGGRAWGLNFPFAALTADEPFLVTTALVTLGLADARRAGWSGADALLAPAGAALGDWPRTDGLPVYSPSTPGLYANTVALWAWALLELGRLAEDDARRAAELAASSFVAGVGWRYAEDNPKVDAVHSAYMVQATRRVAPDGWEDRAADALGRLLDDRTYRRVTTITASGARVEVRDPARHLGECLAATADLVEHGRRSTYWRKVTRRMLKAGLELDVLGRPLVLRDLAHLVFGVARAVEALGRADA